MHAGGSTPDLLVLPFLLSPHLQVHLLLTSPQPSPLVPSNPSMSKHPSIHPSALGLCLLPFCPTTIHPCAEYLLLPSGLPPLALPAYHN